MRCKVYWPHWYKIIPWKLSIPLEELGISLNCKGWSIFQFHWTSKL